MTGISGKNFNVRDPGYNKQSYSQSEVVNSGVFKKPAASYIQSLLSQNPVDNNSLFEMDMPEFEPETLLLT
jgi:hypothetical protein